MGKMHIWKNETKLGAKVLLLELKEEEEEDGGENDAEPKNIEPTLGLKCE